MSIMCVVILTYVAYVLHTMVALAVPIIVFSPALMVQFIVVPLLARNTPLLVINTTTNLLLKLSAMLNGSDGNDGKDETWYHNLYVQTWSIE